MRVACGTATSIKLATLLSVASLSCCCYCRRRRHRHRRAYQFISLEMRSTKEKYFDWKMRLGAERSCICQLSKNKQKLELTLSAVYSGDTTAQLRHHQHHSCRTINRIMFNLNIIIISMYAPPTL